MAESNVHKVHPSEWSEAFDSVRSAKNFFWCVVALAILIQIAGFVLVDFMGVIDPVAENQVESTPTTNGVEPIEAGGGDNIEWWTYTLKWFLPASKFAALVASLLLSLTALLAVKLSLVGRLAGVAGYISGFFWSLFLLVVLIPWQQVLDADVAAGALFNMGQLMTGLEQVKTAFGAQETTRAALILYYLRFFIYPIVALLIALLVQAKFARGLRATRALLKRADEAE